MNSPKEIIEVAAAIITHEGKYLIGQRSPSEHLPGKWEFVGGKVEPEETPEQCVVREVREEIGVEIRLWSEFQVIEHEYPDRRVKVHFFNCHLDGPPPDPVVYPHTRWVALDELPFYDFAEATKPVIDRLFQSIEI